MKKILSIILVAVLLVTAMPLGAFNLTASAATSGTTRDCTWTLNGTVLTISGNGAMKDYSSSSSSPWGTSITKVIIEDGVTSIGYEAFYDCSSLTSITIPNSVTSIGDRAFYDCSSLTSITIPNSVTSIGDGAFYDCTSLTSITIPNSVTSIGGSAFRSCTSLTSITIPNSVTSIGGTAFYNTGYYDNSNNWANKLLYIGNHLIVAKTSISGAYSVKEGTITIADDAFSYCHSLTCITIPNSVTSIGNYAFSYCDSLTSVSIGDSVTSIGEYAFYRCNSLTSVYYRGSSSDKSKISISSNNSPLTNATWYYNSCIGSSDHTYDNPCDSECNLCGKTRTVPDHTYGDDLVCDECGHKNFVLGDIDGTGEVNLSDVTRIANYLAGWNVECNESALDVNGDGVVNLKDLIHLARYVAGWDVVLR